MIKKSDSLWSKVRNSMQINPVNFSGVSDVIVVEDRNKNLKCTDFEVRISKFQILKPEETEIELFINGIKQEKKMLLSEEGIGYFEEVENLEENLNKNNYFNKQKINKFKRDRRYTVMDDNLKNLDFSNIFKNSNLKTNRCSTKLEEDINQNSSKNLNNIFNNGSCRTVTKFSNNGLKKNFKNKKKYESSRNLHLPIKNNLNSRKTLNLNCFSKKNNKIEISLCNLYINKHLKKEEKNKIFEKFKIDFEDFILNPIKIINKKPMIRINDKIYQNEEGIAFLICELAYSKKLPPINPEKKQTETKNQITQKKKIKNRSKKPNINFLKKINLKPGINKLIYVLKNTFNQRTTFQTRIFFYKNPKKKRIIISDIDGTITKSDVLGHIMPIFNINWSHAGIAELYTSLITRNYIIIYLTARNIGQAKRTKDYLTTINEKGNIRLPEGPVITSPDSLFAALHREVIIKQPQIFKIKALDEIIKVFGMKIFGGFGNKSSDVEAYRQVGVCADRIFTIDSKSEVEVFGSKEVLDYFLIKERIDEFFPVFEGGYCEYWDSKRKTEKVKRFYLK